MKKIYLLCFLFLLTACAGGSYFFEPVETKSSEKITYFDVNKIILSSIYVQSPRSPYIDHLMTVSPNKMTRNWLKERFAVGNEESNLKLEIFIKESSITKKPVLRNGIMDTEYVVYRANVDLEIKIKSGPQVIGAVFSKAFEERVVENYLSIAEKNKVWENLVYTALDKADDELEIGINRYLDEYVVKLF